MAGRAAASVTSAAPLPGPRGAGASAAYPAPDADASRVPEPTGGRRPEARSAGRGAGRYGRLLLAVAAGFAATFTPPATAGTLDKLVQEEHLGVATCATSQCHGKSRATDERNVQLNEYTVWADGDRHSIAYRTLESEESRTMARKLGIGDPTGEALCLDCHADNVPAALRGPKFQLTDGVGCEGCHGGSGKWIETHTSRKTTHAENLAAGLLATERPDVRAEVCLSCHLGTADKFATHRLMAAGHPRLSFELDLFSANQPAHYTVDADYVERKGRVAGHRLWLIGQLEQLRAQLAVSRELLGTGGGALPELALFDCHSCHHSMDELRWTRKRANGLEPGSLRLHLPNVVVLRAVASAFGESARVDALDAAHRATLRGAQSGREAFARAVDDLTDVLDAAAGAWARPMRNADVAAMRRALLSAAADDEASDYAEAEQIYFGVESLCTALDEIERCGPALDRLFETVADADAYRPSVFARTAGELAAGF